MCLKFMSWSGDDPLNCLEDTNTTDHEQLNIVTFLGVETAVVTLEADP